MGLDTFSLEQPKYSEPGKNIFKNYLLNFLFIASENSS